MSTTIYEANGVQVDVCGGPRGTTMIQINAPRSGAGFVQIDRGTAIAVAVAILGHFKPTDMEPPAPCCADYVDSGEHANDCEKRCGTEACRSTAELVAHWPGKSVRFCDVCAERARSIARAMGFELQTSPIGAPEPHGARRG